MKKLSTAMLFVSIVLMPLAQEQEKEIEAVNIEGKLLFSSMKHINEAIEVISKEDIQRSAAKSIEDLLSQQAGIDIRKRGVYGTQTDLSIRGGTYEQVLVMINNVRMTDSQTGHHTMHHPFDLTSVERIEIIKGPAAWRYGQNAYAGVINIITKISKESNTKISFSGGDFGTYALGLSSNFPGKKLSHFAQVGSHSSEGYRYNSDYKMNNLWYQNQLDLKEGSMKFQVGFSDTQLGANGFYASPAAKDQYEKIQVSLASAIYQQKLNRWTLHSNVYWRRSQDEYLFLRHHPSFYRNLHIGNTVGGEINARYTSSFGLTGFGGEIREEFLSSNNLGRRNRSIVQLFLEQQVSFFSNKLQLLPGISWAHYHHSGGYFYPKMDLNYSFNPHHKIYINAAKVNRVPTYTDLYYISRTDQGNPDLTPERAISVDVGYRFRKETWSLNASVFGRTSRNAIDWVKQNATEKWHVNNIGNIETKGFEIGIKKEISHTIPSLSLGYTYLDSKGSFDAHAWSKYALDHLKHQLVTKLELHFLKRFNHELVYKYQQRFSQGSYHLLDQKLSIVFPNLQCYLLINNITNAQYTEANLVPMPGRWFHVGANLSLNPQRK